MLIAQISDIHAAADNDNLSRLDRALAWLDRIAPDVLVLTGDLIDNGEIEGYSGDSGSTGYSTLSRFYTTGEFR